MHVLADGRVEAADEDVDLEEAVERAVEAQDHRREFDRSRVEMMRAYAERRDCRREFLLNYFGEALEPPCGNCDNCEAGLVDGGRRAAVPARLPRPARGMGRRLVQRYEDDAMTVLFDEAGYKTLAVELVERGGLLEPLA